MHARMAKVEAPPLFMVCTFGVVMDVSVSVTKHSG